MKSTEIIYLVENQNGYEEQYELEANGIDYKIRLAHYKQENVWMSICRIFIESPKFELQDPTFPMLKLLNATLNDNQERNKNWRTKNRW